MSDLTLFGEGDGTPSPNARLSDPPTSVAAGNAVKVKESAERVLAALQRAHLGDSFTHGDAADVVNDDRNIVARRCKDLVDVGLVEPIFKECPAEECGGPHEQASAFGRRGRYELLWRLTPEGVAYAERINADA